MRQNGFSLLEVLVAFSVLALSIGVLMRIYSGALTHVELARTQAEALVLAQSLLARSTIENFSGAEESAGRENDRYDWFVNIHPYQADGFMPLPTTPLATLWVIEVRVGWRDGTSGRERNVSLKTLRTRRTLTP